MLALFGFLLLGISPQEEIEFNCAPGGCHHDEGGHNGHKDASDVPSKNHDAPDIPDVPDKAEWPFAAPVGRAQVLVIVSDHGSGTTDFGEALNTHPCMFDLGEPFANANVLWATSSEDAAACDSDSAQGSRQPRVRLSWRVVSLVGPRSWPVFIFISRVLAPAPGSAAASRSAVQLLRAVACAD
jgi:hypothetical protein